MIENNHYENRPAKWIGVPVDDLEFLDWSNQYAIMVYAIK